MADRDATLEEAARVKQEGNDLYQSGKFEDARRSYNHVLDLLTSQTSLTRGEKEKRDNLILTAHLNLAACELKLGDNAKLIQHCSLALQMDKESVKAFFRRGLAYHNNKDYELALTDYLEAEELEPQNAEVRKQKEKLLTDIMEACTRVADQETLDSASEEDYHEMVVVYEGDEEADLRDHEKTCCKAARHNEYIPVSQLCLDHLPEQYRTDKMLAFMKALIDSTVHLAVGYSSEERPKFVLGTTTKYPFSGQKYRNAVRTGSGFVQHVKMYPEDGNKVCRCDKCKSSAKPKIHFAEIEIGTAAHVVFDLKEARKSNCYFYYDDDQTDRRSCPRLSGGVYVITSAGDLSFVFFVTHDLQFAANVNEASQTLNDLCRQLKSGMGIITYDDVEKVELSEKVSNLCDKRQEILQKFGQFNDRLKTITKDNAGQLLQDFVMKHYEDGDFLYARVLLDKFVGGDWCDGMVSAACFSYEAMIADYDELQHIKDNFKATLEHNGYQYMQDAYRKHYERLRSMNRFYRWLLDVPGNKAAAGTSDEPNFYDSSHPFTVIVSHPHGLGKKISLGNVTRVAGLRCLEASYQYTNTTCPGSSGAPVFITVRLEAPLLVCYPHSKMVHLHINQSGTCYEF